LGKRLALHMLNEDKLKDDLLKYGASDDEADFLFVCMLKEK
jgi:hypothetical protein